MEAVMTMLADKQESFVGAVRSAGMPAHGTCLARIMGVYLDCHRPVQEGFVGNHAMQFSKGPFGVDSIGTPLLLARLLAALAFGPFSNVCQLFQPNQTVRMAGHDALGDDMIGVLLQPSLSSANHDQPPCGRTSAFLLKTLSQSRIMIGFGNNVLPRVEGPISHGGSGHGQVADADIDPND